MNIRVYIVFTSYIGRTSGIVFGTGLPSKYLKSTVMVALPFTGNVLIHLVKIQQHDILHNIQQRKCLHAEEGVQSSDRGCANEE